MRFARNLAVPYPASPLAGESAILGEKREEWGNEIRAQPRNPIPPQARLQGQVLIFVIPAKAGIRTFAAKPATRNQVQIAVSGSLLPLWEKARMRVSARASAALRAGRPRSQGRKPAPVSLYRKRARAQTRLCGRTIQPFANFSLRRQCCKRRPVYLESCGRMSRRGRRANPRIAARKRIFCPDRLRNVI